jgi:hypothetical protein
MSNSYGANYATGGGERGELHEWGGIVSARISDLARSIGAHPEEVARAVESEAVDTIMDTAKEKGQRKDEDRPTDPELRSVALTEEGLQALRNEVSGSLNRQGVSP